MINTAVILAAGRGTRFGKKTENIPKGFIEFCGIPMIERSIRILISQGIKRIIIGVGHIKEKYIELASFYPEIICVYNEKYSTTNSMWTLLNCREAIGTHDFLLLESDLIYEERAISSLLNCQKPDIMLCSDVIKMQDSYFIEFDDNNYLRCCSTINTNINVCGELVGIHKISYNFYNRLCNFYDSVKLANPMMGYEFALLNIAKNERPLYVLKMKGLNWYEIDDEKDLLIAESRYSDIL